MKETDYSTFSDSMTSEPSKLPEPKCLEISREYDGYFKIDKATLCVSRLDGGQDRVITRYVFERGDAAAILLHDFTHNSLLLVQQYRFPAAVRGTSGWMREIIAGSFKPGEDVVKIVGKEVLEEAGTTVEAVRPVSTFFLSPGGSTERCHLFEAAIDTRGLHGRICGESGTDEDVFVEICTVNDAVMMVRDGRIADAKTIIAIQHLLLGDIVGWEK
jgi:ADP-ribose diphosphatase